MSPKRIVLITILVATGLMMGMLVSLVPTSGLEIPMLSVATLLVLTVPLTYRVAIRSLDPFEPIVSFCLVWGITFVLKPLQIFASDDTSFRNTFDVRGGLESASVLGLLGAIFFVVTYELVVLRLRKNALRSATLDADTPRLEKPSGWFVAVFVFAATAGMLMLAGQSLTETAAGGSSAYQYLMPLVAIPAIVLLLLRAEQGDRISKLSAITLLGVAVIFFAFFGQRAFILLPVSAVFVFYYLARLRRPTWLLLSSLALFVVLPVFTIVEATREHPGYGTIGALEKADLTSPGAAVGRFTEGDTTAMYTALALQMSTEGSVWSKKPGHEVISVITRPIPAQIWPDKPLSSSEELYSRYFPVHYEINRAGSLYSLVSEFYYDSGIVGVIIGMSIVGWAFARLWLWLLARQHEPWAWGLYAPVLLMSTIVFRGDLALSFGLGIFIFGPLLAGFWIAKRRSRVSQRPAPEQSVTGLSSS